MIDSAASTIMLTSGETLEFAFIRTDRNNIFVEWLNIILLLNTSNRIIVEILFESYALEISLLTGFVSARFATTLNAHALSKIKGGAKPWGIGKLLNNINNCCSFRYIFSNWNKTEYLNPKIYFSNIPYCTTLNNPL